jgi:hypothetical protein
MGSSDRGEGHELLPEAVVSTVAEASAVAGPVGLDRHAVITRGLTSWDSYRSWAEQVRGSWESDPHLSLGAALQPGK